MGKVKVSAGTPLKHGTCPRDPAETAEEYLLGRMNPPDAEEYELHYLACDACLDHLEAVEALIGALRRAAPAPSASAVHATPLSA
jgi:anti-sigma factor RsiW